MNKTFNTNSICGPSRAAILTGKYAHINGFYKNEGGGDFDGTQQTFPKILQKNGYQTAVIGKWHLGTTPTGFDYSKVMINHGGQGTYYNTVFLENGKDTIRETKRHSTEQVAYDALNWLDNKRDKDKPFMLMYQFKAPHRPWTPNNKFNSLFVDDLPYPESFNDDYKGGDFILRDKKINLKTGDILIFPSLFIYTHEVTVITEGVRHSFVSWAY